MQKLEFSLEYEKIEDSSEGFPAIILAAGTSSRMKGIDKRFIPIVGIPVLVRTLVAFQNCSSISEIVVSTSEDKIADVKKLAASYAIDKLSFVVKGGNSREESVKCGMLPLEGRYQKVIVHDGARPLIPVCVIERVADALKENDSVTCAVPLKDTIKRVDKDGIAIDTPVRAEYVAAQTPQGVNIDKFLSISENLDLSLFTDDPSILESVGIKTKVVDGDYKNIKITTPEDVCVAEAILEMEL